MVQVTGHSLGAALAHVAAVDFYNNAIPIESTITFGSPRTGNMQFMQYYAKAGGVQWRVTHDRDPVIHLPPQGYGSRFWHVATEVYFGSPDGYDYTVCDGSGEDQSCSWGVLPLPSTRDHLHMLGRHLGTYGC